MRRAAAVCVALLVACGGPREPSEPRVAPEGPSAGVLAPSGRDAPAVSRLGRDAIRAALPEGLVWEMKGMREDGREVLHRFEVVRLTEREVHIVRSLVDAVGATVGEPATEVLRLAVLQDAEGIHQRQGSFLGSTTLTLPAGSFEARGYEVERPSADGPTRVRQWFSDAFPGRAVRYEVWRDGDRVGGAELLRVQRP